VCTHPIDLISIHLLHCAYGNEHMGTHGVVWNNFIIIVWNVNFHISQKQLHVIFLTFLNSSYQ
jgi:hypothetical protein